MDIISRDEALRIKQKWYFTGEPCNYGHISKRQTSNRLCHECQRHRSKQFRDNNPEYHHEYNKEYYPNSKDRTRELSNAYYARIEEEDPELLKERHDRNHKNYRIRNKHALQERNRQYAHINKGQVNALTAKRRAKKKKQHQRGWILMQFERFTRSANA